jgi:hypothetical protein
MSVSSPFCALSLVPPGAHLPPSQTPDMQSPPWPQVFPARHFGAIAPPQSTSVSSPLRIPSRGVVG